MESPVYPADEAATHRIEENWGSLTWVAGGALGNAERLTVGRVVIQSGDQNPRHMHPNCEEVLYLLSGRLTHTFGNESVPMEPGDTIVVPAGVYHNAVNIGDEDAHMIVAFSSADRRVTPESPVAS